MSDLFVELLKLWVLWYASAAFVGAFFGASLALWVHRKIQARKLKRGKQ